MIRLGEKGLFFCTYEGATHIFTSPSPIPKWARRWAPQRGTHGNTDSVCIAYRRHTKTATCWHQKPRRRGEKAKETKISQTNIRWHLWCPDSAKRYTMDMARTNNFHIKRKAFDIILHNALPSFNYWIPLDGIHLDKLLWVPSDFNASARLLELTFWHPDFSISCQKQINIVKLVVMTMEVD